VKSRPQDGFSLREAPGYSGSLSGEGVGGGISTGLRTGLCSGIMSVFTLFRTVVMRSRYMERLRKHVENLDERLHRLEIQHRQLSDHFVLLEAQNEKLAGRLDGRRGGRPPKQETLALDQIPRGDKAALRAAMGLVPGRPFHHEE